MSPDQPTELTEEIPGTELTETAGRSAGDGETDQAVESAAGLGRAATAEVSRGRGDGPGGGVSGRAGAGRHGGGQRGCRVAPAPDCYRDNAISVYTLSRYTERHKTL